MVGVEIDDLFGPSRKHIHERKEWVAVAKVDDHESGAGPIDLDSGVVRLNWSAGAPADLRRPDVRGHLPAAHRQPQHAVDVAGPAAFHRATGPAGAGYRSNSARSATAASILARPAPRQ